MSQAASSDATAPYLLRIDCSPIRDFMPSKSRETGDEFVHAYKASHPDHEVRVRDLSNNQVAHLDGEGLVAAFSPEEMRSEAGRAKLQIRLDLIREISNAHSVLITMPMWNWNVPGSFKSYVDQIIIPGVFDVANNKKLSGKKVTVIISAGGHYEKEQQRDGWDFCSKYVNHIVTVCGCTDSLIIMRQYNNAGFPGMGMEDQKFIDLKANDAAEASAKAIARASSI